MVNSNFSPEDKKPGDLILSADWNAAISEIKRLQQAKVNREGADTLKGSLNIQEALNVTGDVKILGNITVNNTVSLKGSAATTGLSVNASGYVGIGTTTPKIHLAIGDDDTGLQQQGDGQLAVCTNGVERMRIGANSYVGIGTTSPTEKLEVSGNIKATNAAFAGTLTVTGNSTLTGSLTVNNTVSLKGSAATTGLSVNASGNVGIGTTTPQAILAINGGLHVGGDSNPGDKNLLVDGRIKVESGVIQRGGNIITATSDLGLYSQESGNWIRFVTNSGPIHFFTENGSNGTGSTTKMVISSKGYVGIGTDNPTKGKLEIVGGLENKGLNYAWFNNENKSGTSISDSNAQYSLYADKRIACSEFNVHSDARIKLTQGRSNSNADLRLLRRIEITNYTLKDTISNFSGIHKKVIGQQIAQVFPQAVSTITDVVPDIFKSAFISNNWINLPDHGLTVGERVKIIQGTEVNIFTVEAIELDSFKVSLSYNGEVFVYGREVNDFHLVDYDALSMLNISATQELYRIIETLQTEVEQLKAQLHQDKPNKLPISAKQ